MLLREILVSRENAEAVCSDCLIVGSFLEAMDVAFTETENTNISILDEITEIDSATIDLFVQNGKSLLFTKSDSGKKAISIKSFTNPNPEFPNSRKKILFSAQKISINLASLELSFENIDLQITGSDKTPPPLDCFFCFKNSETFFLVFSDSTLEINLEETADAYIEENNSALFLFSGSNFSINFIRAHIKIGFNRFYQQFFKIKGEEGLQDDKRYLIFKESTFEKTSSASAISSSFFKLNLEFQSCSFIDVFGISFALTESAIILLNAQVELKPIDTPSESQTPFLSLLQSTFLSFGGQLRHSDSQGENYVNLINYVLIKGEKGNIFNVEYINIIGFRIGEVDNI